MGAKIKQIEYYFPEKEITNEDLSNEFPDYNFLKFEKKVGIKSRYVVQEDETALDLAEKACNKLFQKIDKGSIDYILYCTQSPEYLLPTSSCILQNRLGLRSTIGALDFNLGCSGYTYGLSLSKGLINSKQAKTILLVTSETYSKYIHPKDKSNRAIFGDAASATVIEWSEEEHFGSFLFGTDGSGSESLIIKNGGNKNSWDSNAKEKEYGTKNIYTDNHLYMNGPKIFNFTSTVIPNFTKEILSCNNLKKEEVDQYIFHQANALMLNIMRQNLSLKSENFFIDLKNGGNTVSCTIPIALKRHLSRREKQESQKIALVGFGVGLSWSGGIINI